MIEIRNKSIEYWIAPNSSYLSGFPGVVHDLQPQSQRSLAGSGPQRYTFPMLEDDGTGDGIYYPNSNHTGLTGVGGFIKLSSLPARVSIHE